MKKILGSVLVASVILGGCISPSTHIVKSEVTTEVKIDTPISIQEIEPFKDRYDVVIGTSDFSEHLVSDGISYGKLDDKGRPTYATARITPDIYEQERREKREPIKVDPIGWPTKNTKETIKYPIGSGAYKGYFWNRSHMIADSLGGEPIKENLITGTRPQNVGGRLNDGGMAYMETKIRNYFKNGNVGTVDYSVANHYETEDDIIPNYTIVNAKSSDGKIDEKVIVYNTAFGYKINYKTATYTKVKE